MFVSNSRTESTAAPTSTGFPKYFNGIKFIGVIIGYALLVVSFVGKELAFKSIMLAYDSLNYMGFVEAVKLHNMMVDVRDAGFVVISAFGALLLGHLMYGMIRKYGPLVVGSAKVMPKTTKSRRQAGSPASSKQEAQQQAPLAETVLQGIEEIKSKINKLTATAGR